MRRAWAAARGRHSAAGTRLSPAAAESKAWSSSSDGRCSMCASQADQSPSAQPHRVRHSEILCFDDLVF